MSTLIRAHTRIQLATRTLMECKRFDIKRRGGMKQNLLRKMRKNGETFNRARPFENAYMYIFVYYSFYISCFINPSPLVMLPFTVFSPQMCYTFANIHNSRGEGKKAHTRMYSHEHMDGCTHGQKHT